MAMTSTFNKLHSDDVVSELDEARLSSDRLLPVNRSPEENPQFTSDHPRHFYIRLKESEKNNKLNRILETVQYTRATVFVKSIMRATILHQGLRAFNFNSTFIHPGMSSEERDQLYHDLNNSNGQIYVTTRALEEDLDVLPVDLYIYYDFPVDANIYPDRVGAAGRRGPEFRVILFISKDNDMTILTDIAQRHRFIISEYPEISTRSEDFVPIEPPEHMQ